PRLVTTYDRPFSPDQDGRQHTTNPNFGKVEYFKVRWLTELWDVLPGGQPKGLLPGWSERNPGQLVG
ncbi:hypothetical protein, partial [Bradyrhizobium sp. BR 10261]|uniref:hypothetical protein n=1 Tax=Bradyrhizobium sp. BR 10261 TaxID=2749992 RepID=UPI001C653F78